MKKLKPFIVLLLIVTAFLAISAGNILGTILDAESTVDEISESLLALNVEIPILSVASIADLVLVLIYIKKAEKIIDATDEQTPANK